MRSIGLRIRAVVGTTALAVLLAACGGGGDGDASAVGRITAAPGSDVLVTQDPNPVVARNSPVIAVNPVQPTNMVIVNRVDRPDYGAGVHVTNNGGLDWQDVTLQRPTGSTGKLFAPSAAYDGRGTLYVSFATLTGPGNDPEALWVTRSGDGGLTFDEPTRVAGPDAYQMALAVDARSSRLFAVWLQSTPEATACNLCFARTGLPIVVSRSEDGGRTWSTPARVSDEGRARVGAPALAVDRDGNPAVLYVDYGDDRWDWENLPGSFEGTFSLVFTRSPDKGLRWEPGQVVDGDIVPTGRFLVYLPVTPGFAIARNGVLLAVWADARSGDPDVLLRRSGDGGRTWTEPVRVNRGTVGDGVPQEMPAVGVAPGGRVDVAYYDRKVDPRGTMVDVVLSSSSDGGESFTRNIRLTTRSSSRTVGPQSSPHVHEADFGSRLAVASLAGGAVVAWTDTRNGTADTGKQDIFTASVRLSDNTAVGLAFRVLAVGGILLGAAGVTLFVLSRRARRRHRAPTAEDVDEARSEASTAHIRLDH
ncbi:MAG: exo-alpha-sialidase [Actinomycetota bacterium]|nr:exo-alpha-sialidase [Actinomycetota bacterium]